MFPDSKICKKMTSGATKTTKISTCLGQSYLDTVIKHLREHPFTLMIDESTDHGADKVLAVLARIYDPEKKVSETKFVRLLECNIGTAQHIFDILNGFFEAHGVEWNNVVAFESDNCSVMKGKHKGVIKLIKDRNPNVLDLGCIAHYTNLCLKDAKKDFPFKVDELLTDIYYHFDKSSKRCEELKDYFADFPDVEYQAILRHCPTRWLSMRPCVSRLIAHYNPLKAYFIDHEDSQVGKVKQIKKILCDPKTLPLLYFLEDILAPVDAYNKLFQSESFILHRAANATQDMLTDLLGRVLEPAAVREHISTDPTSIDLSRQLPDEEIDPGNLCRVTLASIEDENLPSLEREVGIDN